MYYSKRIAIRVLKNLFRGRPVSKFSSQAQKVFCIGYNKTGTTSVMAALKKMGYKIAPQEPAEMLIEGWAKRDFRSIAEFCHFHEAFQDVPFSCPHLHVYLDQVFPNAKFILSVRDDSEQWYRSITRFHAKKFGGGVVPNEAQLRAAQYRYEGYLHDYHRYVYEVIDSDFYNKERYIKSYEMHNDSVKSYFFWRPEKLLVLNVNAPQAYQSMANFLGKDAAVEETFPWENVT